MLFRSGVTPCPGCGRPLDATDDRIAVEVEVQAEPDLPDQGFYHRECFLALPARTEYLTYYRDLTTAYLARQQAIWEIVALTDQFGIAYVPPIDSVMFYAFPEARALTFPCDGPWREFCDFLLSREVRWPRPDSAGSPAWASREGRFNLSVQADPPAVVLAIRDAAPKLLDVREADLSILRRYRPDCTRVGATVDFGRLVAVSGVRPLLVDGLLERCAGIVHSIETEDGVATVRLVAERWMTISFTPRQYDALRAVLARHV
jgi:hypothetical protein